MVLGSGYTLLVLSPTQNELEENSDETLAALSGIFKHVLNECNALKENVAPIFMKLLVMAE